MKLIHWMVVLICQMVVMVSQGIHKMLVVVLTGAASFYATKERQLHYGASTTNALIRESELRAIESILQGGPTVAFDAYPAS